MSQIFLPEWPLLFLQISGGLLSMLGLCLPIDLLCSTPASSISETSQIRMRRSTWRSTTPASGRWRCITSARCLRMPCEEAPQTFPYLAVTHRDNSNNSHHPQRASVLHRWWEERIQAGLGSSSITFICHFYSLICLLMTGAERWAPAAHTVDLEINRKRFYEFWFIKPVFVLSRCSIH